MSVLRTFINFNMSIFVKSYFDNNEKPSISFNIRSFTRHFLADLRDSVFYIFCVCSLIDDGTQHCEIQ